MKPYCDYIIKWRVYGPWPGVDRPQEYEQEVTLEYAVDFINNMVLPNNRYVLVSLVRKE